MQRTPSELLSRLFEYAEESLKELKPSSFQLSHGSNQYYSPGFLTSLPGLSFDVQLPGDNIWLKIDRLEEMRSPQPEDGPYKSVIKLSENPSKSPSIDEVKLSELIEEALERQSEVGEDDAGAGIRKEAKNAFNDYLEKWQAWADVEKTRRQTIDLYGDLFSLMQEMGTGKEGKELVWGLGVSSAPLRIKETEYSFQYPLLTQSLEITLNEYSMALEIRPRAIEATCEIDAFINADVTGATECERAIREHITKRSETPVNPFMPSTYVDLLKLAASSLDSRGRYLELMETSTGFPNAEETLIVSDLWVIFSRPKTSNWLISDLRNIREELKSCGEVPPGPLAFVSTPSDQPLGFEQVNFRGLSSRSMDGATAAPKELYFPLPYNEEQVTIVQRLERAAGVTVQGPPGTGKTHTIANIICHYLANGKRILVTSRGEQALKVLQSKIPREVRSLTVALLAGDREGIRQFQGAIEAIQHQVSQINPSIERENIERLHTEIDRTHIELVRLDRRVNEIAQDQLTSIQIDGRHYRPEELAQLLMEGGHQHTWFDDELSLEPRYALPLSDEESAALRAARRQLGEDLVYATAHLPDPDELPSAEEIGKLHRDLCRLDRIDQAIESGDVPPVNEDAADIKEATYNLQLHLTEVCKLFDGLQELSGEEPDWSQQLRIKSVGSHYVTELAVLRELLKDADSLVERRGLILKDHVEYPDEALECDKSREAVGRAAETGKPFGFISFGTSEAKAHLSKVRVNGSSASSTKDWDAVLSYLQLHADAKSFTTRWNPVAKVLDIPSLKGGIQYLRETEIITLTTKRALSLSVELGSKFKEIYSTVFAKTPDRLDRMNVSEIKQLQSHIDYQLSRMDLSMAITMRNDLQQKAVVYSGPVASELKKLLFECLGNRDNESDISIQYTEIVTELRRVRCLNSIFEKVRDYTSRLKNAGGEKFAQRIISTPVEHGAEDTVLPASWKESWQWARIRTYLERIEARHELIELNTKRTCFESGLAKMYRQVVSKAAWLSTKNNATPMVLQALAGYSTAIRKIGMGTGPNAERYRRDAQQCMDSAAGAIPCWIMSHSKISESMPAEIGSFDLIIVDEASQSDLWALPAIVRGKKVLVVGDDKQVSPDGGFKSSKRISELRDRFLNDQPFGAEMTPEKSLYDLAARVFAGEMVMLREHFRCVPPIITYSSRQFYSDAIQPLRIPRQSERIDPPLVDIYVKDGVRDRKNCNELEAEAIANEIVSLIDDERYAERSIGVVSLLGFEQAKFIDSLVRERCSAVELLKRDFACGDASTFQGSERDIVFMSMVADPENCHPLSGVKYEQRFNVAASRARDRMYLVRSVTLEQLSPKDLRRSLLEYFQKPLIDQNVDQEGLIKLCESGFERDVFSKLIERGYRVIPQVKSGAYRLDMVVEGANDNRLAIECDGDAFHGPDRWEADMSRQRVLERAGWTFWRCFASSWVMRKDEVFEELLETLESMGIEPIGALEELPTLVEYREWDAPPGSCGSDLEEIESGEQTESKV